MSSSTPTPTIWYLRRFLRPYRLLVNVVLACLVIARVAAALNPIWLKKIIDGVTSHRTFSDLVPVIIVYFLFNFLTFFFEYLRDLIFSPVEMGIARTLSDELFRHLTKLPVSYHTEQKIGGLSRQITRGGRAITFLLDFFVINILPTVVSLVITTLLLIRLYPPIYATITFASVVGYAGFTIWATEKRQKYRLGANQADDEVATVEVDALANIETVKYFNNETHMLNRYHPVLNLRYEMGVKSNQMFALISAGQSSILLCGLGALLFLAIRQTLAGTMTIGDLVLLTTYIVQLSAPITTLGFVYRQIKDGLADLAGMASMLQEEVTVQEPDQPTPIPQPKGKVEFDHVSFRYAHQRPILRTVSFTVEPGQRVAFVGPSGAGKSTIVKLLFRFFDPNEGEIRIDGVPLKELSKDDRRRLFAIVPQEPILFNTSIRENILFGKPTATQEEIEHAAHLASIDTLIHSLPEQYDTLVGERGVKLSGGEKQRVAIARAIIREPRILVFDEATSSLDSHSEKEIQKALDTVATGRTTLAVAHRLSTIAHSDQIFVLKAGEIAENGTHEQLLKQEGLYASLWRSQAKHGED